MMEEVEERGWDSSELSICSRCVVEPALQQTITAQESVGGDPCSFCNNPRAAPFDVLLAAFVSGLFFKYDDALNSVPYVSSEGGFVGAEIWDTWDLMELYYDCFDGDTADEIIMELRGKIQPRDWVDRVVDPDYEPEAVLSRAWYSFCRTIKHETRYVFWLRPADQLEESDLSDVPPATILQRVGELIDDLGLFKRYPSGSRFCRARTYDGGPAPAGAASLGTPPPEKSFRGNRMSPAGIPMFYAAESPDMALREASVRTQHRSAAVGLFEATRAFEVVDLTAIPPVPSPFDERRREQTWKILFLKDFIDYISTPLSEGRDQVDYVPPQITTEYLMRIHWGERIRGLRYPSSLKNGHANVVIDVQQEDCIDADQEKSQAALQMRLIHEAAYEATLNWELRSGDAPPRQGEPTS